MADRPVLHVILGSTRPNRNGLAVAEWFVERAKAHGTFDVTLVDLKDVNLPIVDEPEHPKKKKYTHEHTKKWSETVKKADAFVFVSPEYNHGPSPALTNALDYLVVEWGYAPVGFVSYGAIAGGVRAVAQLKPMLSLLRMMCIPESVVIPNIDKLVKDGALVGDELAPIEKSIGPMLDELQKWTTALSALRPSARS